ncbi:MAG: M28 family peptidase [Chitinophagaceae bacterium]
MKQFFLLLTLTSGLAVSAQKTKAVDPKPFAASITEADLKKQLYIIASSEMEGRETATEGQRKAAAYIESQFSMLGLKPGNAGNFQMQYDVFRDSLISSGMVINGKSLSLNNDFQPIIQLNSKSTLFFSEIVFAGHGIVDSAYDDYGSLDVKGKIVILLDGGPASYKPKRGGFMAPNGMYAKIQNASKKGAAAVLLAGGNFPRRAMEPLGNMYTELYKEKQTANAFIVSEKIAESLIGSGWNELKEQGKKTAVTPSSNKARIELAFDKKVQFMQSSNVLGIIEGSDKKDEWLVITAHYDHLGKRGDVIYYGADDDGSGTVSVIEIAEAFAKAKAAGKGPRRSILFMAVSGEEKGLWGSAYYSNNPSLPLDKITANLNIDMIGRTDTERMKPDTLNYVYVVGDDKLSSELKPISESANSKYTKLVLDYKYNDPNDKDRIYYRSDHYNFARKGVPIIFYYDGMLKADYHKPTDTPDKINYPLMAKRAQLVFYTAWEMSNRESLLKRDIPLPADN